ncbi:hypothetical protein NDU88_000979 [Pleurodeles waltl]|uniref:IGFBP N-terminal domain-containing protein n=1 Tax=Pleurodeles waltl TaxID=8319 RepID=A0AAV7N9M8_PLEWA|nr:hypothetical protein NDU88_000979 [Pleurodeles waltl]
MTNQDVSSTAASVAYKKERRERRLGVLGNQNEDGDSSKDSSKTKTVPNERQLGAAHRTEPGRKPCALAGGCWCCALSTRSLSGRPPPPAPGKLAPTSVKAAGIAPASGVHAPAPGVPVVAAAPLWKDASGSGPSAYGRAAAAAPVGGPLVCLPCDESKCEEEPRSVLLGVCGCCLRCAQQRNESCGGVYGLHGACDRGLCCVLRPPLHGARSLRHRRSGRMRKSQLPEGSCNIYLQEKSEEVCGHVEAEKESEKECGHVYTVKESEEPGHVYAEEKSEERGHEYAEEELEERGYVYAEEEYEEVGHEYAEEESEKRGH